MIKLVIIYFSFIIEIFSNEYNEDIMLYICSLSITIVRDKVIFLYLFNIVFYTHFSDWGQKKI
jgi:hypothetical protein